MSERVCIWCLRPEPTAELYSHEGGCECQGCSAACWEPIMECTSMDGLLAQRDEWKARAEKAEDERHTWKGRAELVEKMVDAVNEMVRVAKDVERARIVAWLREVGQPYGRWDDEDVREIADAIERGEE